MGLLPHVSTYSVGAGEQDAVFAGALLGFLSSAALLSHTVLCRGLAGQLWRALASRLQWSDLAMREEVVKKLMTESVHHACCINFFVTVWCCVNCGMMVVHTSSGAPRWMTVWQDAVWIWATFACIVCQLALRHRPHHLTVDAVYVCFMLGQTLFVSVGPTEQVPFISMAGFTVFFRGLWSLACMRLPVVACLTALHFACVCAGFARTEAPCAEDGGSQNFQIFLLCEFIGDIAIILCTVVWRHFCRLRIFHEMQASIAQSENEAARSLLNIVCDATVELDAGLQIVDETPRLASLLQHGCDRSLRGASMLQFVVEEERQQFTDRICSASDECMTNVFHTRVRDGISNVLNMEVFHVRVAGYFRPDSHLIGVREYTDASENVGALSQTKGPKKSRKKGGAWRGGEAAAADKAQPPNAEEPGAPSAVVIGLRSWSSVSSPSSVRSFSGGEGEIVAWIEVLSDCWAIRSSTSGFELFWGCGSRTSRLSPGARGLLEWVKPEQREQLIGWVQASYQEMRAVRGAAEPPGSPDARCAEGPVYFRPPSLWHVKAKIAYAASIALALPEEHQHQSTLARVTFSDIRVVQQGGAKRELQAL